MSFNKELTKMDLAYTKSDIEFEKGCLELYEKKCAEHKKKCYTKGCERCILYTEIIENSKRILLEKKVKVKNILNGGR